MTRGKAFWLSFGCTLAVLLPLYAAALFFAGAQSGAAAAGEGTGIAVRRPDANDSRNLLLEADGGDGAADFYLLRFDALQGRVCVLALPRELLAGERGDARQTLGGLAAYAGPGLAAARLAALLEIKIDHYLRLDKSELTALGARMGNVSLDLAAAECRPLGALASAAADGRAVLSAAAANALLARSGAGAQALAPLRARLLSGFLQAGMADLHTLLPDYLRGDASRFDTDILATDLYDYERILSYLALRLPEMRWAAADCTAAAGGCRLTAAARAQAQDWFT